MHIEGFSALKYYIDFLEKSRHIAVPMLFNFVTTISVSQCLPFLIVVFQKSTETQIIIFKKY